jgi:hypothetical protein
MTSDHLPLDQLQRWLLDAITHGHSAPTDQVKRRTLPSREQTAEERLAVYQKAYLARLLEVLRELFPCTRFAVGDDLFDQLTAGYLQAHPPQSYTLARLADHFVEYLDRTRPSNWGSFVVELSRLEQAIDHIFDAPGPENSPPFVMPSQADSSLTVELVSGCQLHSLEYPVSSYYTEWKSGREPVWPDQAPQFVALFRRDYVVRRYELTDLQYALLMALQAVRPIGDALSVTFEGMDLDEAMLTTDVSHWFTFWAAEGFFATPSALKT